MGQSLIVVHASAHRISLRSQGAALSLFSTLTLSADDPDVSGVLAMSGYLPRGPTFSSDGLLLPGKTGRIQMLHGRADAQVSPEQVTVSTLFVILCALSPAAMCNMRSCSPLG